MRLTDKAEEVLEHLWIMTQEKRQDVVSLEDLKTERNAPELGELTSLKFIDLSDDGIRLRKEGMKEAENTLRRHRLAERLMIDVFDLKRSLMEETACQFEHLLRKEVEESICTLLGHPRVCPHGRAIPPGRCCKKTAKTIGSILSPLTDLAKGTRGKVAYLHTGHSKKLQKLMAMGVLPGVTIEVIQTFPSYVFRVGHSQIAVDEEMAKDVFVRRGVK